jgi:hypothetical protein
MTRARLRSPSSPLYMGLVDLRSVEGRTAAVTRTMRMPLYTMCINSFRVLAWEMKPQSTGVLFINTRLPNVHQFIA